MSTCRGAVAPHENCPHGAACDWDDKPTVTVADLIATQDELSQGRHFSWEPLNRADRRAAAKAARRTER
jgi:hypothetical protein